MDHKNWNQQFYRYVIPSMITMLLGGFYAITDGLFVGNAVGDLALGAINLAYPIQVILNAVGIGLGIGGAVVMATYKGQQNKEMEEHTIGSVFVLLLLCGFFLPLLLYWNKETLLHALGAENAIYEGAYAYISVILIGGLLPVLGNGISPLIRNQGKTTIATICMSSGLITNIVLDYIFVVKWQLGIHGAALATILAQGVVALSGGLFLWWTTLRNLQMKQCIPSKFVIKKVVATGFSPFGQALVPCVVIILTNWLCLIYGGDEAVTIFSIVSYVLASAQLLLQGIGDGVQPLLSYFYGAKNQEGIVYMYKKALKCSLQLSLVLGFVCIFGVEPLTMIFNLSKELFEPAKLALIITALSFPFVGVIRLISAFFYATQSNSYALRIVYIEPCLILPLCLILFPIFFQVNGIWMAYPIAQVILMVIAFYFKRKHEMKFAEN